MMKFMGIMTEEDALKAVENDGYALQYVPAESCTEAVALKAVENHGLALRYVLRLDLFVKVAGIVGIEIQL